jgi:L-seryl-tRNA(Ser) seleniumtransferase
MRKSNTHLQLLPSVDAVLKSAEVAKLAAQHGRTLCVFAVREALSGLRARLASGSAAVDEREIPVRVSAMVHSLSAPALVQVVNATGVILHTNLGRAVLGETVLADMAGVVTGYSNLEFDLASGGRGSRHDHVAALLRFLTGAEDVLVVNNNAAAIVLALSTLAAGREVIVSRGELIEIGGEFRIPDIMAASGCKMVEVGTTNRTRISDYEKAITADTAVIFKAHKSNYSITGFVEEAPLEQCAALAHKKRLPFVYDLGSGLLRKVRSLPLENEPDAASAVAAGADLVLFSGDKLLGGPQAGIIAGRKALVARLARAPLMRALRVGKLTLAALSSACRSYLDDNALVKNNPTFAMLSQNRAAIMKRAETLAQALAARGIPCTVEDSQGQCGGGTLPGLSVPSAAVVLDKKGPRAGDSLRAVADRLRMAARPVAVVLREGRLVFDMLAVAEADVPYCAEAIAAALGAGEP